MRKRFSFRSTSGTRVIRRGRLCIHLVWSIRLLLVVCSCSVTFCRKKSPLVILHLLGKEASLSLMRALAVVLGVCTFVVLLSLRIRRMLLIVVLWVVHFFMSWIFLMQLKGLLQLNKHASGIILNWGFGVLGP